MCETDKDKVKGIVATVVFHALLILTLLFASLYYSFPPKDNDLAMVRQDEILFGGEYVMLGDFVQPNKNNAMGAPREVEQSEKPTVEGDDNVNMGETGKAPSEVVTQEAESPMKVEKVENSGPTEEELAAEAERVRREKETAEKINKRIIARSFV